MRGTRAPAFAAVVLAVALWPLAHRLLVVRLDADPWKLGGFAMYTSYQTSLVALFEPVGSGLRVIDEQGLGVEARLSLQRFRARRSALGRAVRPDGLARTLHAERPEIENLVVVVQRMWLDPTDARIASEKTRFLYARGEPLR